MKSKRFTTTLGSLLSLSNGKSSPERSNDLPYPVYGGNGIIGFSDKANSNSGTIIIGRVGSYCGSVHFSDGPCWITDNAIRAKATDGNDARFLYYMLHTLRLNDFQTGSGQPLLNQTILSQIPAIIPTPSEQRLIAHILGTLDEKIELNRQMNETLEATARAIFKSWFMDFDPVKAKMEGRKPLCMDTKTAALFPSALQDSPLGKIPQGWSVKALGNLSHQPQYGYTASAKDEIVGPKFLRITDINKKAWINWSSVPHCEITEKDFDKYRLHKGDVLIARMADPGHGVLIEEDQESVFASYLIRFCPIHSEYARFFQYWLRSDSYWKLVRGREIGTTRASLNAKTLSGFPLVTPPLDIVEIFSSQISSLRDRIVANTSETESLASLRDTLLPKLLSGEIRVDDAAEIMEENDG
ncbi:MAG: restriction endonuclease subunit S [Candidatus Poribacteria bacterium]|nr:restriction endonuclease subunit S [Candidatus Poribacteria bacterium]